MDFKKIHQNLLYDEFGNRDYEGYIFLIPIIILVVIIVVLIVTLIKMLV